MNRSPMFKHAIETELESPLADEMSGEYPALLEGQLILVEKSEEVALAFNEASKATNPSQKIIMGYTALNRAVDFLNDQNTEKAIFRRTLRNAAVSRGEKLNDLKPHLDSVMRLRTQVVHSAYDPTENDAREYLNAIKTILEMIGCAID